MGPCGPEVQPKQLDAGVMKGAPFVLFITTRVEFFRTYLNTSNLRIPGFIFVEPCRVLLVSCSFLVKLSGGTWEHHTTPDQLTAVP